MFDFESLRSRLVAAMILPALIAIAVAVVLYDSADLAAERATDRQAAQQVADGLARRIAGGGALPDASLLRAALPNDQVVIAIDGETVMTTTPPADVARRQYELTAAGTFPHGTVVIRDRSAVVETAPNELILVAAAPVLLLVLSAVAATSYLSRALRRQIGNARRAAEGIIAGDLSARMGPDARGEFVGLARAFDGRATRPESPDRTQRQFLGDLAHELATPVTGISGNGLALADGTAVEEATRRQAATTLTWETRRLQELLADLRNLTRLDLAETVHVEASRSVSSARRSLTVSDRRPAPRPWR